MYTNLLTKKNYGILLDDDSMSVCQIYIKYLNY